MAHSAVHDLLRGRWTGTLSHFGVESTFLKNKHGPCIKCGGRDRARYDNKGGSGSFICSKCGSYSAIDAIMHVNNWSFKEAVNAVEKFVGHAPIDPPKREISPQQHHQWMAQAWRDARPIEFGDPVDQWLTQRLGSYMLDSWGAAALRCHPALPFWQDGKVQGEFPAMVARVLGPDRVNNRQLHRTYLTPDGQKAMGGESRSLMPGVFPAGSYIPLMQHTDLVLGIAEGIETALAAAGRFKVPVHAAVNASNLQAWTPPPTVQHVIVFGDNDESMTGQAAAYALAKRLIHERSMGKLKCTVEVQIPTQPGYDWNKVCNPDL